MYEKLRIAAPASVGFMYNPGDALKTRAKICRLQVGCGQSHHRNRTFGESIRSRFFAAWGQSASGNFEISDYYVSKAFFSELHFFVSLG
jgi:hypothetical protein